MARKLRRRSVDISLPLVIPALCVLQRFKMIATMTRMGVAMVLVALLLCLVDYSEANYKNAPMNGIMFGKRGPSDYDARSKTFSALCEIATEACQTWFPSQENK